MGYFSGFNALMELESIKDMIMRASPAVAANLLKRLEQIRESDGARLPFDELIELAREKTQDYKGKIERCPSVSRIFFTPFESLFEDEANGIVNLPGSFDRAQLKKIWEVISTKIANQAFETIVPKLKAAIMMDDKRAMRNLSRKLREVAFDEICELEDKLILHNLDNSIPKTSAVRFVNLLAIEYEALKREISIEVDIADVNDAEIREYVQFLTILDKRDLNLAADFMLCLMGNSKKPWQAMRVIKAAVVGISDRKLAATAYSVLGDRLLAMMGNHVDAFAALRKANKIDGKAMALAVEEYNLISIGIERCNILIDGGPWMIRLKEHRARAAQLFHEFCERAEETLSNAFPLDKGRIKGVGAFDIPRCYADLSDEKVELAMEFAVFIRESRLFAPNAGFGAARETAHRNMLRHCDGLKNGLIAIVKHEDRGKFFDKWADIVVEVVAIIDDASAAKSLERKIAA